MKLKEIPQSWLTSFFLKKHNPVKLNQSATSGLPVIISLTSIPSRLASIHLTIRSLLLQEKKPEKIILWLHFDLRNQLPKSLAELQGNLFEIRYVDLNCSHRKLIHSLEAFPDKIIVTCDDDLMYDSTWLLRLYKDHERYPGSVIAHECRLIAYDAEGNTLPYKSWKTESRTDLTEKWLMPIGYGGVLYPPSCLYKDVCNRDLFLKLTPHADDLWFKAMSLLKNTPTRRSSMPGKKPTPIIGSQKFSLKKNNVKNNGNFLQWAAVFEYYNFKYDR